MVQLSPDTQIRPFKESYKWASGYRYEDTTILGFLAHALFGERALGSRRRIAPANLRRCAAGARRYRQARIRLSLSLQPRAGTCGAGILRGRSARLRHPCRADCDRARGRAPVYLSRQASRRHVLIDLRSSIYNYPGKVLWSRLRIREDGTVTGMRETRGWAPGRQLYFAIRFSQPIEQHSLYDREPCRWSITASRRREPLRKTRRRWKAAGSLRSSGSSRQAQPLVVKVALSPVSEENAIANMDAEAPRLRFRRSARRRRRPRGTKEFAEDRHQSSRRRWKRTSTPRCTTRASPNLSMDADGSYRGPDNQVHHASGFHFVSNLSLWDTFRAEQPLMTIA